MDQSLRTICQTLLVLWSISASLADSVSCPDDCVCSQPEEMTCSGTSIKSFPVTGVPSDVTQFFFTNCLMETVGSVPYIEATTLVIHNCAVSQIADGAFLNLSRLQILHIDNNNHLTNLSKDAFLGLNSLTSLSLSDNMLTKLPDGVFQRMPMLQLLDLSTNSISFSSGLFEGASPSLSHLTCDHCSLDSLPIAGLDKLPGLKELEINQNNFSVIPDGGFQTTPSLRLLSLDQCGIRDIAVNAFLNLVELQELIIGHNLLYKLEKKAFRPFVVTLKKLSLENNKFTSLQEDLLAWNTLKEVRLGDNSWNCDCSTMWIRNLSTTLVIDYENVKCVDPVEHKGSQLFFIEPSQYCKVTGTSLGRRGTIVVCGVLLPLLMVTVAGLGYCMYRAARRYKQIPSHTNAFKYSHVYHETVESNSKTSLT